MVKSQSSPGNSSAVGADRTHCNHYCADDHAKEKLDMNKRQAKKLFKKYTQQSMVLSLKQGHKRIKFHLQFEKGVPSLVKKGSAECRRCKQMCKILHMHFHSYFLDYDRPMMAAAAREAMKLVMQMENPVESKSEQNRENDKNEWPVTFKFPSDSPADTSAAPENGGSVLAEQS